MKRGIALLIVMAMISPIIVAQHDGHDHDNHEHSGDSHHADKAHDDHGGGHHKEHKEEQVSDIILHHIRDTHDWHIFDVGDFGFALHLPWIIYDTEKGLQFYSSTHALEEATDDYVVHHEHIYKVANDMPIAEFRFDKDPVEIGEINPDVKSLEKYEESKDYVVTHTRFIERENAEGEMVKLQINEYEIFEAGTGAVYDFSITKTGIQILIVAILMFFIFTAVARGYKKNEGKAPSGIQSFMEPVILFVREDIAKPFLHGKHDRFMPYLLTLFFFIWFANLLGLMPFNSNIAGNTTITIMLSLLSFILILANSTKDFWAHIFWFPGVPILVKPLMMVVEILGLLTKPAALAIRLFANISAGHFMVLSLVSLIFILGDMGYNATGAWTITPLSLIFGLFILGVEVIVAAVQAFVFAMLTAVFIGQSMETHGHDDHH